MYAVIWEYRVKEENRSEFEKAYSSNGAWAELFRKGPGYIGTELLRSERESEIYTTIDRWESKEAYERFLAEWQAEYKRLDERCEGLTEYENRLGGFTRVTP